MGSQDKSTWLTGQGRKKSIMLRYKITSSWRFFNLQFIYTGLVISTMKLWMFWQANRWSDLVDKHSQMAVYGGHISPTYLCIFMCFIVMNTKKMAETSWAAASAQQESSSQIHCICSMWGKESSRLRWRCSKERWVCEPSKLLSVCRAACELPGRTPITFHPLQHLRINHLWSLYLIYSMSWCTFSDNPKALY